MINMKNGYVHGTHRKKAVAAGTLWRIHWANGQVSIPLPTDTAYLMGRGNSHTILFMENMDMAPFLNQCINAMKEGITMGDGAGLFFSYIGENQYTVVDPMIDPWNKDEHYESERDIRRRLQIYYTSKPQEMEEDKSYIEEWMGSAE